MTTEYILYTGPTLTKLNKIKSETTPTETNGYYFPDLSWVSIHDNGISNNLANMTVAAYEKKGAQVIDPPGKPTWVTSTLNKPTDVIIENSKRYNVLYIKYILQLLISIN